jgi:hypothetical protein
MDIIAKKTFLNSPAQKKTTSSTNVQMSNMFDELCDEFPRLRGICPMAIGRLAMANKEPVGF